MKFARVIGRVTLSVVDPAYEGARFILCHPWHPARALEPARVPLPKASSLVAYDNLGASLGDLIGYSDGGEAAAPFEKPTGCDAYCAAILDRVSYQPPVS